MRTDTAYLVCEDITRAEARNFSYGIRLLPAPKRRALSAVYAMARRIDDIGDGDHEDGDKLTELKELRETLHPLDRSSPDPVVLALADTAARFPVPVDAFDEIVQGCIADVSVHEYETFEDLVGYCRWVAGSVGRLSVGVYSARNLDEAWPLADTLGIALQLTNILRDVLEDRQTGRVYLPQEDLDRFGCTLEVGPDGRIADDPVRFARLIRFEAARTRAWYDEGLQVLRLLDRRSAACTAAMAGIYRELLERIADDPVRVGAGRVSVPAGAKIGVAGRALVRGTA